MRTAKLSGLVTIVLGASLVAACGSSERADGVDEGDAATDAGAEVATDAAADAVDASDATGADDAPDIDASHATFGLDERPANTSCVAPARPPTAPVPVRFERVFSGLSFSSPMGIAQIPGDPSRFFVFQRGGTVVSFSATTPTALTTVLTVPRTMNLDGEGGLLGLAFHPDAAHNGHVFFSYTTRGGSTGMQSVVARMTSHDGGLTFGDYTEILGPFSQPYTNHDGGDVHFGTDGLLYLSFGDGGAGGDPLGHGQNTSTFFSKILRIDVDHGAPYAIPADNPFAAGGGAPETFAYGFRNPFRFSVDRATGDLWVGDVGQNAWEEIDAKVALGGNYGWNTREGKHCYSPPSGCTTAGLVDPLYDYDHTVGQAITGGVVYRGKAVPELVGTYLYADFVAQTISGLSVDAGTGAPSARQLNAAGPNGSWVGFGEDQDGEVYVVDLNGGIYALLPAGQPPPPSSFPDKLSKTGCFDPADTTRPGPALVPYAPHSPLWSDGAAKERWLAVPDGKTIHVGADGDFDLPIGSVLVKSFRVGGKPVETRLLVRHDDGGWAGYTYAWDADGKDATLLASSETRALPGGGSWYYPSRGECLACHTGAAGRTLGLEIAQLNADFTYVSTARIANQLATLAHIGLFDAPLPGPPSTLDALPAPTSNEGTAETRGRSYLHANCSFCHRPNGVGGGPMDLRWSTKLTDAKACGVDPSNGDLGVAQAKILAPGDPSRSLLSLRPKRLGAGRMPPLASRVVDPGGTAAIDAFISSLTTCP